MIFLVDFETLAPESPLAMEAILSDNLLMHYRLVLNPGFHAVILALDEGLFP